VADRLSPDMHQTAIAFAAQGNAKIESTHFSHLGRYTRLTRGFGRLCGAASLGILSAGIAVFVVMIVLNAIFQYAPAP